LHGAVRKLFFGMSDLRHVEVDAHDPGRLAGDVGEDGLVGEHRSQLTIRSGDLGLVLLRLPWLTQQLAIGGLVLSASAAG